jgi:hypothetical protein
METQTEVMRHRVRRIGTDRRTHLRPVERPTVTIERTPCPEPEIRYESPAPHAGWIIGGWLLALVAGVALGVGLAHVIGG